MSTPIYKPLPIFAIISPDGEYTEIHAGPRQLARMAYDHVVEFEHDGAPARMHHWDNRKHGAALNSWATGVLHLPDVVQIKGQKRRNVYGDAFVRSLHPYPCIQASGAFADLEHDISTYFPGTAIYVSPVGQDLWDVFFLDPAVTQQTLFTAAMVLG